MKRIFAILLALAMVLTMFAGCGSENTKSAASAANETSAEHTDSAAASEEADLLAQIQAKGEITIGLEGDWAPWSFHGDEDTLAGFDVEVAQKVAEKLGVKANIIEGEWDGLFAGLDAGRYDVIVNGVEVTEERSEKYDFTDPYAYIRTALIVRADNEEIQTFEDLSGKTTANSIASTYMNLAESYGAEVSGVDTLDETLEMVLQGRVDATLNAVVSYTDYMAQHPDAELKIVATTEDASLVCMPLRKDESTASLREAVNAALKELREEGVLRELSEKYFGEDISE